MGTVKGMNIRGRVLVSILVSFNLLLLNLPSSRAEDMPSVKTLQNAAIKTLKEFDTLHKDKVSWDEADVIKSIKNSKLDDWVPLETAYALRMKSGFFASGIQLVLRPEHWGGAKENKWVANIRKQIPNADKFVYIRVSGPVAYKNKSYRTFDIYPFMPWTDNAVGYTENEKVVDIGTAGVGCFTLPKAVRKGFKIACAN